MSASTKCGNIRLLALAFWAVSLSAQSSPSAATPDDVVAVPAWLELSGAARLRWEIPSGSDFADPSGQGYFLTRLRLDFGLRPWRSLRLFSQFQDSRILGFDGPHLPLGSRNPLDLKQGYLEYAFDGSTRWQVRAGRQEISLGSGRFMSPADFSNVGRSFDAIRATVANRSLNVDLIAGSVVLTDPARFDRHKPGDHVFTVYATLARLVPYVKVEPYLFAKRLSVAVSKAGHVANAVVYSPGFRVLSKDAGPVNFSFEVTAQRGDWASDRVRGYAYIVTAGYAFLNTRWKPHASADYNYASGDSNPKEPVKRDMEPFYGNNQPYFSITSLIGWKNMKDLRSGVDFAPVKRFKVSIDYRNFTLATVQDAFYNAQNTRFLVNRTATSAHVGQGIETVFNYDAPHGFGFSLGIARLFPGEYLKQSGRSTGYFYPYLMWLKRF